VCPQPLPIYAIGGASSWSVAPRELRVHPKKRRGRPATGKDPLVSARLSQELIDRLERWAASNEISRSEALRRIVELGLKSK
jgi:hypothetical protein